MLRVHYDLLKCNTPMWGSLIFPQAVVEEAIARFIKSQEKPNFSDPNTGYMRQPFPLEICRYEAEGNYSDEIRPAQHATDLKWGKAGEVLETIGKVDRLWIVDNELQCDGVIEGGLCWPHPLAEHTAIPYLDMKFLPGTRTVCKVDFTEIVLSYQVVTRLALRKYHERKSILGVDS